METNQAAAEETAANASESGGVESPTSADEAARTGENVENNESAGNQAEQNDDSSSDSANDEQTDWQERYLRLYAEFDNFRKRTTRERVDLIRNASRDSLEKMLPILDDFSRAEQASKDVQDADALKEGQALIHTKFKQLMEGQGIQQIDVNPGDLFDVDVHEAITRIPSPEYKGKIVDAVEAGYKLNDVVIRYTKVVVGE
jgi:molecular chaperone GrpE|tara:strand:+ start:4593 stop:5195 length:603 start_codon:yes stop_codon:yes gene_type:complete